MSAQEYDLGEEAGSVSSNSGTASSLADVLDGPSTNRKESSSYYSSGPEPLASGNLEQAASFGDKPL
jgi:hypothetical protein